MPLMVRERADFLSVFLLWVFTIVRKSAYFVWFRLS